MIFPNHGYISYIDVTNLKAYTEIISRGTYLGKIFSILRSNNLIETFDGHTALSLDLDLDEGISHM